MNTLYVFSDGSARSYDGYKKFDGSYAFVVVYRNKYGDIEIIKEGNGTEEDTTLPRCEFRGMQQGLKSIVSSEGEILYTDKPIDEIVCVTDSALLSQTLTLWIHGWLRRTKEKNSSVLLGSRGPVKNQDIILDMFKVMSRTRQHTPVKIYHINSHVKNGKELNKAYKTFERFNGFIPDNEIFMFMLKYNDMCDVKANEAFVNTFNMDRYKQ